MPANQTTSFLILKRKSICILGDYLFIYRPEVLPPAAAPWKGFPHIHPHAGFLWLLNLRTPLSHHPHWPRILLALFLWNGISCYPAQRRAALKCKQKNRDNLGFCHPLRIGGDASEWKGRDKDVALNGECISNRNCDPFHVLLLLISSGVKQHHFLVSFQEVACWFSFLEWA